MIAQRVAPAYYCRPSCARVYFRGRHGISVQILAIGPVQVYTTISVRREFDAVAAPPRTALELTKEAR
jgi:hypothetical protein